MKDKTAKKTKKKKSKKKDKSAAANTDGAPIQTKDLHVELELANEMQHAYNDLQKATKDYEAANDIAKTKRKAVEAAKAREHELLGRLFGATTPMPLFDGDKKAPETEAQWRKVKLGDLHDPGMSDVVVKRLASQGIMTIGDIEELKGGDGFQLASLKGIGKAKATEIENALEGYWVRRQKEAEKQKKVGDAQK